MVNEEGQGCGWKGCDVICDLIWFHVAVRFQPVARKTPYASSVCRGIRSSSGMRFVKCDSSIDQNSTPNICYKGCSHCRAARQCNRPSQPI